MRKFVICDVVNADVFEKYFLKNITNIFGGKMKKTVMAVVILALMVPVIMAADAAPTATPVIKANAETVKIAVKYSAKKEKQRLKIDEETSRVQPLISGASYIYNSDNSAVMVIYTLPKENEQQLKAILGKRGSVVKANEIKKFEGEFKGLEEGLE